MPLSDSHRQVLHDVARRAIEHGLVHRAEPHLDARAFPPPLREPQATFVTLRHDGALLGCIGTLRPTRPLVCDTAHNAYHAAFSDPRFEPLGAAALDALDIHISILSPLEPLHFTGENDLLSQLRVGIDGLVIGEHGQTATFLPAMWNRLGDPQTFLRALKDKAGLPQNYWSPSMEAWRYTVEEA